MYRRLFTLATAAALTLAPLFGHAQGPASYPSRAIRIVAHSTPGAPPDLVARIIGDKLGVAIGQAVVIENRPGAGGVIALEAVAKAAPDGYTLGTISTPQIVAPSLVSRMPYDTEKDLAPVTVVTWAYNVLAVTAASPAKSVADLVALARATPGALKFSSGGNGTPAHLAGELFKREAGVNLVHVPYKGAPAGAAAMIAGDVDMMVGAAGSLAPYIKSGRLRALATSAPQRIAAYPELPTLVELGYPGLAIRDWFGLVAPAGTPKEIVARLHSEFRNVVANAEVRQRLDSIGMEAAGIGPEEFAAHVRSELRRWGKVVREAGIKAD
jgi:tripartite-type tricarboxylate transporter receptor subunit TctC